MPLSDGLWKRSWAQSGLCWAQSDQSARDAACSSRAQVALQSCFLSFGMELSCQSCLAELFLKPSHGTAVKKLPREAISQVLAWNHHAKAALRNYFLSFCMELLFRTCSAKLFLELSHGSVVQKLPFEAVF